MKERLPIPSKWRGYIWKFTGGHYYSPHRHEELELNFIMRGGLTYLVGNRRLPLGPQSLLWLFPEQNHVLIDHSKDCEMWIGVFRQSLVREMVGCPLTLRNPSGNWAKTLRRTSAMKLAELLQAVTDHAEDPRLGNAGLSYLLLRAWMEFSKADDNPDMEFVHPAVERAARLLADNPDAPHGNMLAAASGLSRSRLSRLFKQQMGVPLAEYRNRKRMDRFQSLYQVGQRRTKLQAALEAGFGSYAQFHRVAVRSAKPLKTIR